MNKPTICITGGHPTPALAVAGVFKKAYPSWSILWIGRKYAFEGKRIVSSEYKLVESLSIRFIPITTGRLQRSFSIYTIPSLLKIPIGFVQAFLALYRYRPSVVVSFGGYVALPVAYAAFCMGIPVITHEQTYKRGLANVMIGKLAKKICVTFPETLKEISEEKAVVTGLPIRQEIFDPPAKPSFQVPFGVPILYITGGSTGATTLNDLLFPVISDLLQTYCVIHQTGEISFNQAMVFQASLKKYKNRYIIAPFFSVSDVAWILRYAKLVIGRAGANTVAELEAVGKKAILVPLPWAGGGEQEYNARMYVQTGRAICITQEQLTPQSLYAAIEKLESVPSSYVSKVDRSAAMRVVKQIELYGICRV